MDSLAAPQPSELSPEHPEVQQLVAIQHAINELRATLDHLESSRDAALRRLDSQQLLNRAAMGRLLGISRARVWQILNPVAVDESGEPLDPEEYLSTVDQLWDAAVDAWEAAGQHGTPADFFSLDAVVRGF
jgi:hypothetical protein